MFEFKLEKKLKNNLGRAGVLKTPHGEIKTPAFSTVGTKATVKSLTPEQVKDTGAQVVLANTYHLYLEPGEKIIREHGGLHGFMNWQGPIMTDSGGFQAFSLGVAYGQGINKFIGADAPSEEVLERGYSDKNEKKAKVTEDGVEFKSIIDGSIHFFSPEKSMQIQHDLGADIIFAFDECTSPHATKEYLREAMERTHRWAERSLGEHKRIGLTPGPSPKERGDLFGWNTASKDSYAKLQEQALNFRKNPTQAEEVLWNVLRNNIYGYHFRRQHVIDNFIVDFVCLSHLLVIEVDGEIHNQQAERDTERQNILEQLGFRVLRFSSEDVINNSKSVLNKILEILKALPLGEGLGGAFSPLLGRGVRGEALPQSLFGIVQGGRHEDLRKESAAFIGKMDFDGFGIGGSFVKEDMATAVKWVNEILPEEKPRHLLGVAEPIDLFLGVENGCDTFDCVAATRMSRNGSIYTKDGRINIRNAEYRNDLQPLEDDCSCYTCKNYSRSYVAHLFRANEMLAATLATIHNLTFINSLMAEIRKSILEERFFEYKDSFLSRYFSRKEV